MAAPVHVTEAQGRNAAQRHVHLCRAQGLRPVALCSHFRSNEQCLGLIVIGDGLLALWAAGSR